LPDRSEPTLRELEQALAAAGPDQAEQLLERLEQDRRRGAQELARRHRRRQEKARRREARWRAFCDPEFRLHERGQNRVAGVDEAGRGPLAGPVVAAAVILPKEFCHHPLDDSKRMTSRARETAYEVITAEAEAWAVGAASPEEIDRHNILGAVHLAVARALEGLEPPADFALVDGLPLTSCPVPHQALVKGDRRSRAIAAASVLAKVTRDRLMIELESRYPGYGFAEHKGYATAGHFEALDRLGPSPVHRRSFGRRAEQLELPVPERSETPQAWGAEAEDLVAADYQARGYLVLARRWRGGGGELDLVCTRAGEIVLVEVKAARGQGAGDPIGWVQPAQRRRWRRSAAAWLAERPAGSAEVRFDLVGVRRRGQDPPELVRFEGVEP
jgi:ribonuclease HII